MCGDVANSILSSAWIKALLAYRLANNRVGLNE